MIKKTLLFLLCLLLGFNEAVFAMEDQGSCSNQGALVGDEHVCPACQSTIEGTFNVRVPCGHIFHVECLYNIFEPQENMVQIPCPLCQQDLAQLLKNDSQERHSAWMSAFQDAKKDLSDDKRSHKIDMSKYHDDFGWTRLHAAAWWGRLDVAIYLVAMSNDVEVLVETRDDKDETPLFKAISRGKMSVVRFLVEECRADVNACGKWGKTPLFVAYAWNHKEIARYLIEHEAIVPDKISNDFAAWLANESESQAFV